MLERANLETEFVGDTDEHQDFVSAVTVRMDIALSLQYFNQGFKLFIFARRDEGLFARRFSAIVIVPLFFVLTSFDERFTNRFFDSQSSRRVTRFDSGRR